MAFRFRKDSKEEFEKLGYSNLQCDAESVQPPEGFPPIKTKHYPESVWDKALWPPSPRKHQLKSLIMKGDAKKKFLLTDKDLEDLVYIYVKAGVHMSKKFLYKQVERRAWEKYGGPTGWRAAAKEKTGIDYSPGGGFVCLATKDGIVKGGLTRKGAHAPPSVPRKRIPQTLPTTPSITSAASPAVQTEETIPSTPRKRGNLVRLHTQPRLSMPAYPAQDNIAPSTPTHARISARQSLSRLSPSLTTPTRSISSQNHADHRSSPSAIAALDSFVARSPTLSPTKRRRESEPGPSTPTRSKRRRLYKMADDDDDDEPPPRSPTPLSSPVRRMAPRTPTPLSSPLKGNTPHTPEQLSFHAPRRQSKAQDDTLELTGSEDDDYVSMKLITPKKSKGVSPRKRPTLLCDDVIEISD